MSGSEPRGKEHVMIFESSVPASCFQVRESCCLYAESWSEEKRGYEKEAMVRRIQARVVWMGVLRMEERKRKKGSVGILIERKRIGRDG